MISTIPEARDQISGLPFAVILLSPDLIVRDANQEAENLIGASTRRLIGQKLFDLIEIEERRVSDWLHDETAQFTVRTLEIRVGVKETVVTLTVSPVSSHPGWRVLTFSDTWHEERFRAENPAGVLRAPAVLAHEIKNPLAAIRGAAQLVGRKLNEADQTLMQLIIDEVDRIAQLIDRMHHLGREQPDPTAPVNPHEAVRRACNVVMAIDCDITLREEFDPSLPPVMANEGGLIQILVNLLSNALEACRDGKDPQVVIRTRFVSGMVMNVIRLGRPVRLPVEIQVSDNGPGIDRTLRDHIFEPFVSSKRNGQGLGLALVNKLIRDMNGRISHERDEAGGWTHFRIHLPVAR